MVDDEDDRYWPSISMTIAPEWLLGTRVRLSESLLLNNHHYKTNLVMRLVQINNLSTLI